jgi:hypothetical protein
LLTPVQDRLERGRSPGPPRTIPQADIVDPPHFTLATRLFISSPDDFYFDSVFPPIIAFVIGKARAAAIGFFAETWSDVAARPLLFAREAAAWTTATTQQLIHIDC